MSDFHVLIFLATNNTVHFNVMLIFTFFFLILFLPFKFLFILQDALDKIIEAILNKNAQKANEWSRTPEWLTVEEFFKEGGGNYKNL